MLLILLYNSEPIVIKIIARISMTVMLIVKCACLTSNGPKVIELL